MAKLENLFEDKYYIEKLKIPEEFIKGFQYYCIEDVDFSRSLKEKNKTMSMFLIVGLASEFNKNQMSEIIPIIKTIPFIFLELIGLIFLQSWSL